MKKKLCLFFTIVLCISTINLTVFAQDVELKGNVFTIDENFTDDTIPEGFTRADISYEGQSFKGIANGDDTVFKFYLTCNEDASQNGWYTYLGKGKFETSEVAGDSAISFNGGSLTVEEPGDDVVIPNGIVSKTFKINEKSFTGYVPKAQKGEVGVSEYLVYGTLDGTEHAWFLYNSDDNMAVKTSIDNYGRQASLEKNNKELNKKNSRLVDKYNRNIKKSKYLFLFMCVATMLFFFLMLNAMIKRKHMRLDLEDRILDLRLNNGQDTMKISKKDLEKRNKKDAKAMERNDISPSAFENDTIRKRRSKTKRNETPQSSLFNVDYDEHRKKNRPQKRTHSSVDINSIEKNMNELSNNDDIDDDIEFVSLDL